MVTSGKQDIHLTINPEITFFKKVYKKYSNFSMELNEITSIQSPNYNNIISFIINYGDALYRCYLEIELPSIAFTDKYITNSEYIKKKNIDKNYNNELYIASKIEYDNLKNYIDIQIEIYRNLYSLLQTDNISIIELHNLVSSFLNKSNIDQYINKIDNDIYNKINISGYILSINEITSSNTILNTLEIMYNSMIYYLKLINKKKNNYLEKINDIDNGNIKWNYTKYLGHQFFQYFSLEIGGQEIQKYSNDVLHIHQMHNIKEEYMANYNKLIGNTDDLYTYNKNTKGNKKILVPLIFWFNKDPGGCLPLVSLQYSTVVINTKINNIIDLICFQDYESDYIELLEIVQSYTKQNNIKIDEQLIYKEYTINNDTITYHCLYINDILLKYKFPDLTTNEINIILDNGILYTSSELETLTGYNRYSNQKIMNKYHWIKFMLDIKNTKYNEFSFKIAGYYPYIDYNIYYSIFDNPKIKLIGEFIFFDDTEREKFANNKLDYIIEEYKEDIFDIKNIENNKISYDCELSFDNLCKELMWYIQPKVFINGLSEYSQNLNLIFDTNILLESDMIQEQSLIFNQLESLIKDLDMNYYENVCSYKYLNNILPKGIYYKSFCLYPEESQPSGTINFRYIKSKHYSVILNDQFTTEYYNFLKNIYNSNNYYINNKNGFLLKFIAKAYSNISISNGKFFVNF